MLNFVDISKDIPFRKRGGAPSIVFGLQGAKTDKPIDFQIYTSSTILSFQIIKIDSIGTMIETIDLEISLLTSDGTIIKSTGEQAYITELSGGLYYFKVNTIWESEIFAVVESLTDGTDTVSDIAINGLTFYDTEKNIDYHNREGAPWLMFATEFGTNTRPLQFSYQATEPMSSFKAICVNSNLEDIKEIEQSTGLINANLSTHICRGTIKYTTFLSVGLFYYLVNDRYRSQIFQIAQLTCWKVRGINITNAVEKKTLTLFFIAELTGLEDILDVDIDISFSCGIETVSDTINLNKNSNGFTYNILVPSGVSGDCTVILSTDLCPKEYTYDFYITPSDVCYLDLENGTTLELENGTFLRLENCITDNIIELIGGDDLEFVDGGGIEYLAT